MVDLDVPGLPIKWLIVIDDKLASFGTLGDEFAICGDIEERSDGAIGDLHNELGVSKLKDIGMDLFNGRLRSRVC